MCHESAGAATDWTAFETGQHVHVLVNREQRQANAARLCAARLIEGIGRTAFADLEPIRISSWPTRSYVDFGPAEYLPDPNSLMPTFQRELKRATSQDLRVTTIPRPKSEFICGQIEGFPPFVCTGPYPQSVSEAGEIVITRIVAVQGRIQVRFRIGSRFSNDAGDCATLDTSQAHSMESFGSSTA